MASLEVLNASGKKAGTVDLPDEIFAAQVNVPVMHRVVRAQLAAARAGTHSTKTRSEVRGGGKKPWRQKGTGRARAGSIRSPLWTGGGTIFGPRPRDYTQRLPRSARRAALRSALAARHAEGRLVVVEEIRLEEPRTKRMLAWLAGLGIEGSVLVVLAAPDTTVGLAARNLPQVKVLPAAALNVYDVLGHATLVMTRPALEAVAARLGDGA